MMLLCLRYISDVEDAKEVLMDSFYSFFKKIDTFTYRGAGSVKAWLKRIVVNQCLMHLRNKSNKPLLTEDVTKFENKGSNDSILDQLSVKDIMKLLQELPEGYRVVFNLYVFEGMNHREIGNLLEVSESTSKSQLHRARKMLQEKILLTG